MATKKTTTKKAPAKKSTTKRSVRAVAIWDKNPHGIESYPVTASDYLNPKSRPRTRSFNYTSMTGTGEKLYNSFNSTKDAYYLKKNAELKKTGKEVKYNTNIGKGKTPNKKKDDMYVALPAGWRKSVNGKWYFENRINRTDNKNDKARAWNSNMSAPQKQKAYKHLVAVESKALMDELGNPQYVRYVVKYNDWRNNPQVTHNRARAKLVNRLAIKQGKKATNPSALYLNNREYVASHKGYHIVGNQVIKNKDYSDIAAYRDLVERRISKKGGRSKRTGYVSIPSIVAPVKKSTTRKASNKGRKPSTRKSTPKVATVLFVDARTTKKAPVKKATPKAKGRKTSAKKSRR